jgi:hypothetical protein
MAKMMCATKIIMELNHFLCKYKENIGTKDICCRKIEEAVQRRSRNMDIS